MEVAAKKESNNLVIFLIGELDEYTAPYTRSAIDKALDGYKSADIIFDLSGLTFMDSSGLGVILGRYSVIVCRGGRVLIGGANRAIDRILRMAGIYTLAEHMDI